PRAERSGPRASPGRGGGRSKEPKEPGPLGQRGEQAPPVAAHTTIERPVADAFEGKEHPQGDDLAGPETGLGMFRHGFHPLVYPVEQLTDKVLGSQAVLFGLSRCGTRQLGATAWLFSRTAQTSTIGYYPVRGRVWARHSL